MKKISKILIILMAIGLYSILFQINIVQAATNISTLELDAGNFINTGATEASGLGNVVSAVTGEFTGLGQILTMIGAGVMVAATAYMGIKYIVSPPDKQAALKQQLVGLVVSGIVIFGAYGIWKAVVNIASAFSN